MENLQQIFEYLIGIMNNVVGVLVAVALLGFLWGVLKYFIYAKSPDKRKDSNKFIVYGLLSLLVITSVWGFVYLLASTFGINIGQPYIGDVLPNPTPDSNIFDGMDDIIPS